MAYTDFIAQNVAPYSASQIGVYNSSGTKVGKITLGSFKPSYGTRLYRFGLLSDVHNQSSQADENTADFQRALAYFNEKESVCMTCICGDATYNGTASELQLFKTNVETKSPDTDVYTTTGNHDATTSGLNETQWQTYTGHGRCFEITKTVGSTTDHFIFFGMNKWDLGDTSGNPYLESDITWLEDKLEAYRNQRVFLFTHLFFKDHSGNFKNIYKLRLGSTQLTELLALLHKYPNVIWFSGHSHWKWYLQKYEDSENVYRETATSGWTVHVPSCAYPRDSDGVSTSVVKNDQSEGAIVDVYENYIDIRGMNLKDTLYLPIAQYRLDTTIQTVASHAAAITNNLTHCSSSNSATTILKGRSYSATITADNEYTLSAVTVTMGGTDISSTAVSGGVITIANVTGNIVITGTTTHNTEYTITNDLSHCTSSNSAATIIGGNPYSATLTPSTGYNLGTITVTMSGTNITSSAVSGSTISIADVTGNIIITCAGVVDSTNYCSVDYSIPNCTSTNNSEVVAKNGSYSATITANDEYTLGTVTVTMGGTDISSTAVSGGTISISSVTGNLVITATATGTMQTINTTWKQNTKIDYSNGGAETSSTSYYCSDYIPYSSDYTYYIRLINGIGEGLNKRANMCKVCLYDSNKTLLGVSAYNDGTVDDDGATYYYDTYDDLNMKKADGSYYSGTAYFRIRGYLIQSGQTQADVISRLVLARQRNS